MLVRVRVQCLTVNHSLKCCHYPCPLHREDIMQVAFECHDVYMIMLLVLPPLLRAGRPESQHTVCLIFRVATSPNLLLSAISAQAPCPPCMLSDSQHCSPTWGRAIVSWGAGSSSAHPPAHEHYNLQGNLLPRSLSAHHCSPSSTESKVPTSLPSNSLPPPPQQADCGHCPLGSCRLAACQGCVVCPVKMCPVTIRQAQHLR